MKIYIHQDSVGSISSKEIESLQEFTFLISAKKINLVLSAVTLNLIREGNQYSLGEGYLHQHHFESNGDNPRSILNEYPGAVGNTVFRKRFHLVFSSSSVYSNLHEILGSQQFLYCLGQLNELGYISYTNYSKYEKLLDSLKKSSSAEKEHKEDFRYFTSVVEKSAKFADEIGYLIKKRNRDRILEKIQEAYSISLQLKGFSNTHSFDIRIGHRSEEELSQDTYIFVGANGLGKTQCLKELYRMINEDNHWRSNLLWYGFSRPSQVHQQMYKKIGTNFSNLSFRNLFRKMVINSNRSFDRLHFFQKEAKRVLGCDSVSIKVGNRNYDGIKDRDFLERSSLRDITVDFVTDGKKIILSSGQSVFINMLCLILSDIEVNDVLFIDEADAFFHPRLCSEFIQSLNTILQETRSCAFFITHSVFTTREVLTPNIFKFSSRFSEDDKRMISVARPSFNTFGASIDRLADYLFEDDSIVKAVEKLDSQQKKSQFISVDAFIGDS